MTRTYWRAEGRSLDIARAFLAKRASHITAIGLEQERLGAEASQVGLTGVAAMQFRSPPLTGGLRPLKKEPGWWTPDRSKQGREIAARWRTLRLADPAEFTSELFPESPTLELGGWVAPHPKGRGMAVYYALPGEVGDAVVISLPLIAGVPAPPDAVRLQMSEYWAMREAAGMATEEAA